MTAPAVNRVLETALYVADLDRSQAFYERVFGFVTMLRDHRMCALAVPGRQALLLFRLGGSVMPSETPVGTIPPHDGHGRQHLCFAIDRGDLDAWQAHLEALGMAIESRLEWPTGGSSLYFRDPDQHSLEVGTPGLWLNDQPARGRPNLV
ncbi:MAG: glyoxalase [Proteobacteria bacterium]|nr:glyoxalase [Pseudomonadota bacterium]